MTVIHLFNPGEEVVQSKIHKSYKLNDGDVYTVDRVVGECGDAVILKGVDGLIAVHYLEHKKN